MNKLESIVIVKGDQGSVATVRFTEGTGDRLISSSSNSAKSKETLYTLIEKHVEGVLNA